MYDKSAPHSPFRGVGDSSKSQSVEKFYGQLGQVLDDRVLGSFLSPKHRDEAVANAHNIPTIVNIPAPPCFSFISTPFNSVRLSVFNSRLFMASCFRCCELIIKDFL